MPYPRKHCPSSSSLTPARHPAGAAMGTHPARTARSGAGDLACAAVSHEPVCDGSADRLGQRAGRSDYRLTSRTATCCTRTNTSAARPGAVQAGRSRHREVVQAHPHAHEPASGRPDDPQRADAERHAPLPGLQHKYTETVLFFPERRARPATPIAPSASAGRNSSAWTT